MEKPYGKTALLTALRQWSFLAICTTKSA